jgi:hypothetical protein
VWEEGLPPDEPPPNRGRRRSPLLLLAIVILLLALLIGLFLLWRSLGDRVSATAEARDSIDAGAEPTVRLVNGPGQVRVEGVESLGDVEYVVVRYAQGSDPATAKEEASGVPVDVAREGGTITLETDGGRGTGADYTLRVPRGSKLEVESRAGDVNVTGVEGDVSVVAEAGDVTIGDTGGSVSVEAAQGDVSISGVNTDAGQTELVVGSGDVRLEDLILGTVEASVEAGDVEVLGRFSGGGRIVVETGNITSSIPPEDARELTLEARVGTVVRETQEGGGSSEGGSGEEEQQDAEASP